MRTLAILLVTLCPHAARADGTAGDFDYYVLSLSWSPNWCAREGEARDSPQCAPDAGFGWVLHGLWPQYEEGGWPQDCHVEGEPPSRAMTEGMADIMGTSGLAWYQWNKHGSCSGLAPPDYFATARRAFESVAQPDLLQRLDREVTLPATLIEEAFTAADPDLDAEEITITCRDGYIQEARICLTRDLEARACGAEVDRDCSQRDARFLPVE